MGTSSQKVEKEEDGKQRSSACSLTTTADQRR